MPRRKLEPALLAGAIAMLGAAVHAEERYGIGRVATPAEIAGWNIDIGVTAPTCRRVLDLCLAVHKQTRKYLF